MRIQGNALRNAAVAVVSGLGLFCGGNVLAGVNVGVGINIGGAPPPPRPVIVEERVVTYDTYVVGHRRFLYDADWRLRQAQVEEISAQRDLDAARRHEGEVAVALDDQEAVVAELGKQVAGAGANVEELRVRLTALERRITSARSDLDSARVLHDRGGVEDAEHRLAENERAAACTVEEIKRAEDSAAARGRLAAAQDRLGLIRADFDAAHDAVFAAQGRMTDAHDRVCIALHDRDDALWRIYGDDIVYGRVRPETVGFTIDLNAFGGRMPRDPEVVRRYVVRDVGYWRERPVEIQTRVIEVDRVGEISRCRQVQHAHEGPRIVAIETAEVSITIQDRRQVAERVVVERQRVEVERVERTKAASEGRRPRVSDTERAEAKAIVTKAQAEAKATEMKAHADAKATEMQAHADAKSTEMKAHADAKATKETAHANAKATEMTAHGDAKATEMTAHGDAKAKEMTAHGDAKAKEMTAHGDAKATEMTAHGDAKAKETTAHGDAKAKVTTAQGDAKSKEITARGDAKAKDSQARTDSKPPSDSRSKTSSKYGDKTSDKYGDKSSDKYGDKPSVSSSSSSRDPRSSSSRDPRAGSSSASSKDPKKKGKGNADPRDDVANTDPNR